MDPQNNISVISSISPVFPPSPIPKQVATATSRSHLPPYLTTPSRLSPAATLKYTSNNYNTNSNNKDSIDDSNNNNNNNALASKSKPQLSPMLHYPSSNKDKSTASYFDEDDTLISGGNRRIDWKKWYGSIQNEALAKLPSHQKNELLSVHNQDHFFSRQTRPAAGNNSIEISSSPSSSSNPAPAPILEADLHKLLLLTPEQRQQHFLQLARMNQKALDDKRSDDAEAERLSERIDQVEANLDVGWGEVHAKMLLYENVKNTKARSAIEQVAELRRLQHIKDLEQKRAETERGIVKMLEENNRQKEKEKRRNNNSNNNHNEDQLVAAGSVVVHTLGENKDDTSNDGPNNGSASASMQYDLDEDDDTGMRLLQDARARFHAVDQEQHDAFRARELSITERRSRLFMLKEESHRIADQKMMISRKKEEEKQQAAELVEAREHDEAIARQARIEKIKAEDKLSAVLFEQKRLHRMRLEEDRLRRAADRVSVGQAGRVCEEEARFRRVAADAERKRQIHEQKRLMLSILAQRGAELRKEKDRSGLLQLKQELLDQIAEIDNELEMM